MVKPAVVAGITDSSNRTRSEHGGAREGIEPCTDGQQLMQRGARDHESSCDDASDIGDGHGR
jgi:hypothetical protein